MLPEAAGRGQHFQARVHSFSLYGPTLSRKITFFFPATEIGLRMGLCYFVIALAYVPSTNHRKKSNVNERVAHTLDKELCVKEQIYFELLYDSCI